MVITSKLVAVGSVVASFLIGCLLFYIMGNTSAAHKKKYISEVISQLINVVLFIWGWKIILHFSLFLSDPLAVLAYPGDAIALYLAVFSIALLLLYKQKQKKLSLLYFLNSFAPIFLTASFCYEFIEITLHHNGNAVAQLALLTCLIILYFFLQERWSVPTLLLLLLHGWSFGMIILNLLQPVITSFGYTMDIWFIGLFYITMLVCFFIYQKRSVTNGNY
ncbi:hypothetical protein [Gracilibacillus phocaeensis]|uniref:hypothetical protein n=1 Tax=Gracilibacillus phocaeensis TaxID=2042304 RepID=UPI001A9163E3|nr:hypothetical protein [Gracilibacillus phocaeensis]